MLQAADTDIFHPLVSNAHNGECQNSFTNYASKSQLKLISGFLFYAPSAPMG